jgi:hypothetical protein
VGKNGWKNREVLQRWIGYLVRLQNAGTACRYPRCRKEVLLEVNSLMRRDSSCCSNNAPPAGYHTKIRLVSHTQEKQSPSPEKKKSPSPQNKSKMSAEFEKLAEQIAELREQELELEEMGLEPEELEEARREIRQQLQRDELEMELLEEQEAQEAQEAQEELEEEIRRQREELEREQQEARARELEEMEMIQVANAEPRPPYPPAALTPLQKSLQRVYGSAFPALSTAELCEYLRIEEMQEMEQGEERRMERQLERHARIEVRFLLQIEENNTELNLIRRTPAGVSPLLHHPPRTHRRAFRVPRAVGPPYPRFLLRPSAIWRRKEK